MIWCAASTFAIYRDPSRFASDSRFAKARMQ